jgi:phenol 2-monooxygenase (NADPH)
VLACDGAHSNVRRSLGYKMLGDSTDAVWGVMDVYPRTNFPDIRKKATLHSEEGALLIIPREGGNLCRFYIELPEGTKAKDVTLEDLQRTAKKMFGKYELDIAETFWWSAYSIGQRLAERFSKDNRIFLTGDACHTHSPKAGQGMNVSLQDGYNIGWKLGMVLTGQADESLLKTYDDERGRIAKDLIEFDRRWTKTFSPKHAKEVGGGDPEFFANEFIKAGRYTAGLVTRYPEGVLTDEKGSKSQLASKVEVGARCPSAQVVRFCDANAMQLARAMRSDGRWRVVIFAGDITKKEKEERLNKVSSRVLNGKK